MKLLRTAKSKAEKDSPTLTKTEIANMYTEVKWKIQYFTQKKRNSIMSHYISRRTLHLENITHTHN